MITILIYESSVFKNYSEGGTFLRIFRSPGIRAESSHARALARGEWRTSRAVPSRINGNPIGTGNQKVRTPLKTEKAPVVMKIHLSKDRPRYGYG